MDTLKTLALSGGEWVLYALGAASVFATAVILERWVVFRRERAACRDLRTGLPPLLEKNDWDSATRLALSRPGAVSAILRAALAAAGEGPASVEERALAARLREKLRVEKRLLVLGTLGNNAPFIGLFGTVLGVISAFHDLAQTGAAGPEAVMSGLSDALLATAFGLLVAIPSVVAYNYFVKSVEELLGEAEAQTRLLLSRLKALP